jgi:hypothetical protein
MNLEQLLDGLFLYEITLLILGSIFFLVLIVLLIVKVSTRQPIKVLIPFFFLPILMIGFPGIEQFNFMNGMAELKTKINQAIDEPDNQELREEIREAVDQFTRRPIRDPKNLMVLGEAYEALDESAEAKQRAREVRQQDPGNEAAIQLLNRIDLRENIRIVEENPRDEQARSELQRNISALEEEPHIDVRNYISIARGHAVLGDTMAAEAFADSVERIRPQVDRDALFKRDIIPSNR